MKTRARIFVLAALLVPFAASARSLHWKSIDVRARLDSQGLLHVSERQNMVFDGEWNGGERRFRVGPGQDLTLLGVTRIDPASGAATPLVNGDLSAVDRFAFVDPTTLRWRSRLPSDPPFSNTEIDYVLDYTLSGVLEERHGAWSLAHDFAFPDRDGSIDRFTVALALDSGWTPEGDFPGRWEAGPLAPGRGFVVRATLRPPPGASPRFARHVPILADRRLGWLLVAAALVVFGLAYGLRDAARGRFRPLPSLDSVDERWLAENVFDLLPEEVGTALDDDVGRPEVAAVIARLVAEKKLRSEPETASGKPTMRLTRVAPLTAFAGYERKLVDGLFFDGDSVTPEDLRAHYRSSGFNPSSLIAEDLKARLAGRGAFGDTVPAPSKIRSLLFFAVAVAFGALTLRRPVPPDAPATFIFLFSSAFCVTIGSFLAKRSAESFVPVGGFLAAGMVFPLVPLAILSRVPLPFSPTLFWAFVAMTLVYVSSFFHLAASRDGAARMEARRRIVTARRWFARELGKPRPALRDAWYPYLLALGLDGGVERWSKGFAAAGTAAVGRTAGGGSSSSGGESGWTGGGGSFGGAGASGGWAAAVAGFSAGVAAPSSSSSGGGGGSSGGGGGGGW